MTKKKVQHKKLIGSCKTNVSTDPQKLITWTKSLIQTSRDAQYEDLRIIIEHGITKIDSILENDKTDSEKVSKPWLTRGAISALSQLRTHTSPKQTICNQNT